MPYQPPQDPDGPESRQAAIDPRPEPVPNSLNILGLRNWVYGICAVVVLVCLLIAIVSLLAMVPH